MSETTNKRQNRRKPKEQDKQINQQEGLNPKSSIIERNCEAKDQKKDENIESSNKLYDNTENKNQDNKSKPNTFLTRINQSDKPSTNVFLATMARRIMSRLYELYGYSIKGDTCRRIIEEARSYAIRENVNIQDNIQEIKTAELYDNILNVLSLGYLPPSLDTNYNDILLRAIIDRYKVSS